MINEEGLRLATIRHAATRLVDFLCPKFSFWAAARSFGGYAKYDLWCKVCNRRLHQRENVTLRTCLIARNAARAAGLSMDDMAEGVAELFLQRRLDQARKKY